MVNGAGLAMATMDIIKLAGGEPGELPRRGRRRERRADRATRSASCSATPSVRAVLINIFGGILRCDVLAEGVIAAVAGPRHLGAGRRPPEGQRTESEGQRMLARVRPQLRDGRRHDGGRARAPSRPREERDEHPRRNERRASSSRGSRASDGTFHAIACREYGTNVVGGVTPGQGRARRPRASRSSTPSPRRSRETGANASRDLRAARRRRRRHHGGGRRGHRRWSSASPRASRRSTWSA